MRITRRHMLQGASALALSAVVFGRAGLAFAQDVSVSDLMQPGPLPEQSVGKADAPVTIVEYASMTCSHCAEFHTKTYPELKTRYIDTGKVRYILREFPLDPLAAGAFMIARCAGGDKYFPIVEALFAQQRTWVVQQPIEPLKNLAKQFGMSQGAFEDCLADQKLLDKIEEVRQRGAQKLGVNSTPTFFINGKVHRGFLSIEELEKLMAPYLKS